MQPPILHIMVDQMQWQVIAGRSKCHMPNVQRIVDEGLLFERAYTTSAVCCPARAALASGAYPWHNGVYNQVHVPTAISKDLKEDAVTYSLRLKEAGYRLSYVGKWGASVVRNPLDFGYDHYDPVEARGSERTIESARWFTWPGNARFAMWGISTAPEEETHTYRVAQAACRELDRLAAARGPWMLEVHFPEPHDPYLPIERYARRYRPEEMPVPVSFHEETFTGKPGMHRKEAAIWGELTECDVREGTARYFAFCEQVDAHIGIILDHLEHLGLAGDTLVVFTSDHGDMLGAHRMWIKGWMPYEECYRIPMAMRWPGRIRAGERTRCLVQLHDLAHTYVEVAGAGALPYPDGRSLTPLFDGDRPYDWRESAYCAFYGAEFLYTQRMVITERYKYVFNGFDFDELYDLQLDRHELENVAGDPAYEQVAGEMQERIYRHMAEFGDPLGESDRYLAARYLPRGAGLPGKVEVHSDAGPRGQLTKGVG